MDKIIGDKKKLAVELGEINLFKKEGKLRLWIENKAFGTFAIYFSFAPSIKAFETIISQNEALYDISFNEKGFEEIFKLSIVENADIFSLSDEEYELMERYQKFGIYFGDQFDDVTNVIFVRENFCYFLWSTTKDFVSSTIDYSKNFQSAKVSMAELQTVYTEYKQFIQ